MEATATEVRQLTEIRDTRKDAKPLRGLRCKVRIDCMVSQQQLPGDVAALAPFGVSDVVILKKDLPALEALVERDTVAVQRAHEVYRLNYERELNAELRGADPYQHDRLRARFAAEHINSPQAEFRRQQGGLRDMMPFRSVTVIESELPEAVDEERVAVEAKNAGIIANAVREALSAPTQKPKN